MPSMQVVLDFLPLIQYLHEDLFHLFPHVLPVEKKKYINHVSISTWPIKTDGEDERVQTNCI